MAVWRTRASPGPGAPTATSSQREHFGPAGGVDADRVRHGVIPLSRDGRRVRRVKRAERREARDGQQQRAARCADGRAARRRRSRRASAARSTSAENVENVVRPPRKPVMTNSRHSGARSCRASEDTRRRIRRDSRRRDSTRACRAETPGTRGLSHVDSPQRSHAPKAAPTPTAANCASMRFDSIRVRRMAPSGRRPFTGRTARRRRRRGRPPRSARGTCRSWSTRPRSRSGGRPRRRRSSRR